MYEGEGQTWYFTILTYAAGPFFSSRTMSLSNTWGNIKHSHPRRLIRNHPYRGVCTTRGKRPTKASSSSPQLRRGWLNWILRVSRNSIIRGSWIFLSQTVRPLIEILSLINPSPNYIMGDATRIQHGAARRILGCREKTIPDEYGPPRAKALQLSDNTGLDACEYGLRIHKQS